MTAIYTDPETGKKYDRMPGGVAVNNRWVTPYVPCSKCAFAPYSDKSADCYRAHQYCTLGTSPENRVYFYFKWRKA